MEEEKLCAEEWKYHGEGNKSLVVSHGQLSRVLRLLKYPAEDSENPPQTAEQAFRHIQNIVDFSSNVMSRLLGDKFVHSGEVVKLPLEFVRKLSIKVQHQRPAWRCDKVMDIYSGCALCLPNLTSPSLHQPTHTPPLCIEIKPKCGFLPSSKHVSKDIKTKVCRFCMHQHYKVSNGKWKRRSLYCPLDLFSGNRQRMQFAVRHLIEEPQNNLKIFKGGVCVYSSKEGSDESPDLSSLLQNLKPYFLHSNKRLTKTLLHDLIQVLVNALLSGGGGDGGMVTDRRGEGRSYCDVSQFNRERIRHGSHGLPEDSVLSRVLQTQMLDTLDIEGLFPLYRRLETHLQAFPKERSRLQVDGPYNQAFLEKLQKCPSEDDGSVEFAATKVHQYRVAMTAKDCSIMVALVPSGRDGEDDEGPVCVPSFSCCVSILDLDPKPLDSVPRQLRLDHKIVSCFLRGGPAPGRTGPAPSRSSSAPTQQAPPPQPDFFSSASTDRDDCTLLFHPV